MTKRLFIGNLPFSVDDAKLSSLFSPYGKVVSSKVITDKFTGQSRGFGFVEMSSDIESDNAIAELNDTEVDGRKIAVNVAKPMEDRPQRDFGGSRGNFDRNRGRNDNRRGR